MVVLVDCVPYGKSIVPTASSLTGLCLSFVGNVGLALSAVSRAQFALDWEYGKEQIDSGLDESGLGEHGRDLGSQEDVESLRCSLFDLLIPGRVLKDRSSDITRKIRRAGLA